MIRHDQCTFIFSPLPQSQFSTESNLMWIKAHDQKHLTKKSIQNILGKVKIIKAPEY